MRPRAPHEESAFLQEAHDVLSPPPRAAERSLPNAAGGTNTAHLLALLALLGSIGGLCIYMPELDLVLPADPVAGAKRKEMGYSEMDIGQGMAGDGNASLVNGRGAVEINEEEQKKEDEDRADREESHNALESKEEAIKRLAQHQATMDEGNDFCSRLQPEDLLPHYTPRTIMSEEVRDKRWDRLDGGKVHRDYAPKPPSKFESTVYCKDTAAFNQTCLVRNAYMVPHQMGIELHAVGDRPFPSMRLTTYGGEKFGDGRKPVVRRWKSVAALEEYMASKRRIDIEPLTLSVKIRYQQNWAHAFFDGLYPAYVGLAKFGRYRDPYFTLLSTHELDESGPNVKKKRGFYSRQDPCFLNPRNANSMICRVREAARLFGSLGDSSGEYITWHVARRCNLLYRFNEMILGSGSHGQRQATTQLPMSLSMKHLPGGRGVLPLFRERLFRAYGFLPVWRSKSNEGRDPQMALRAFIADNERFSLQKKKTLFSLVNHYREHCRRTSITFIEWSTYNSWRKQLRMIMDADIWITSVGSAQYYGVLLQPGSVVLQVGYGDPALKGLPHYGEEFVLASSTNIRVVHVPLPQVRRFPTAAELAHSLERAADLIEGGFPVPVDRTHHHLSVFADIVMEARRRDPFFDEILAGVDFRVANPLDGSKTLSPKTCGNCPRKYPAEVVYETRKMQNNCFLKPGILRQLKKEFRLPEILQVAPQSACVVCLESPGRFNASPPTITEMPTTC